jgi:hypothetical protein
MADYGEKKERITMQRAIYYMMSQMGLSQLHFVVIADLTNKLLSLMCEDHLEDLSQGIHPFCVDGAAPSLLDARELVGVGKAAIPRNSIYLIGCTHRISSFWCCSMCSSG